MSTFANILKEIPKRRGNKDAAHILWGASMALAAAGIIKPETADMAKTLLIAGREESVAIMLDKALDK